MSNNVTGGNEAVTVGCGIQNSPDYLRHTALNFAIQQFGDSKSVDRVLEAANKYYAFLTAKS